MKKIRRLFLVFMILSVLWLSSCNLFSYQNQKTDIPDPIQTSLDDSAQTETTSSVDAVTDMFVPPITLEPREDYAMTHTRKALTENKKLTVAYIGGSVTTGTGAKSPDTESWRALTTKWFRETYPDAEIKEVNASIGGTGSCLGSYRFDYEVMSSNPDLVFIEFAINDHYENRTYQQCVEYMESMVRKALRARPCTDIIIVLTTDKNCGSETFTTMRAHIEVAEAYGIPYVCVGKELAMHISSMGAEWSTYFSDQVHPNATGYAFYFDVMRERLISLLNGLETVISKMPKKMLAVTDYVNTTLLPANSFKTQKGGIMYRYTSFSWVGERYGGVLTGAVQGAEMSFSFTGTEFGVLYDSNQQNGRFEVLIDGECVQTIDCYNTVQFPVMCICASNLNQGEHTVTVRILSKNDVASGSQICIGAFLYH